MLMPNSELSRLRKASNEAARANHQAAADLVQAHALFGRCHPTTIVARTRCRTLSNAAATACRLYARELDADNSRK